MKILSFGGGVQTITLAVMSALGDFERPDAMVFADTGWEPKKTYEYIEWFKEWLKPYGIPLIVRSKGNIRADALTGARFASMPVFTIDEAGKKGMLMRQCTNEYKVQVVQKAVREYMGLKKFQRVKEPVEMWLGISCDEATRQKDSRIKWITNRYPLIELGYYRETTKKSCIGYLKSKGVPVPPKSACIGCPFHNDTFWAKLKKDSPEEFEDACQFDDAIRNSTKQGIKQPIFLHSSRTPLRTVIFKIKAEDFQNECEGHCGV
jgi:hypothetical protein